MGPKTQENETPPGGFRKCAAAHKATGAALLYRLHQQRPEGQSMETKMNTIRTALAAAALVAGVFSANAASAFERWIEVVNTAGVSVVEVRISHIDNRRWGPDILPGVIAPGRSAVVDPVNIQGYCRFDVEVTYADGLVADIRDVNLCEALTIETDGYYYQVYTI
jgi:hypothetical protein